MQPFCERHTFRFRGILGTEIDRQYRIFGWQYLRTHFWICGRLLLWYPCKDFAITGCDEQKLMHFHRRNSAMKRRNVGTFSGLHPSSCFAPLLHEHREGIVNLYQRLCCYAAKYSRSDTIRGYFFYEKSPKVGQNLQLRFFLPLFTARNSSHFVA